MSKEISLIKRLKVYDKYNGSCSFCVTELKYKDMQVDHIVPRNRGLSDNELLRYNLKRLQKGGGK